jgi:ATP-binding cassette subfamily B protein/subfamily B ATP-binding cassette protein MsbA
VARFYDPVSGHIEFDGRDLREIQLDSYRRLLGIVDQDVFLFDGTITENIGYGRRGATQDAIVQAARAANAHRFILELDDGYETLIGERGVKLSGGQRQRLAIARALLADPKILILDEATSHLDSESEALIQQSLQVLMRGRTCFMIAHRMSTVALANRVVVFDQGRILEAGTHAELMDAQGHFREMVERQLDLGIVPAPPRLSDPFHSG